MKEKENSNVDKLLYLKQQKEIIEKARQATEKAKQVMQFQRELIIRYCEDWSKMDDCIGPVQEDIDWYTKEYILPIQEKEQELHKLEQSLMCVPQKHSIIGTFFERLVPGITKEGRQKRKLEKEKQEIKEEIDTYKAIKEKSPFTILGANKDSKEQLIERMDINQLDKYSTMKNDSKSNLKPNNSVKSIADKIKQEDMTKLLKSYPALKDEAGELIDEFISNGQEAFNQKIIQIVNSSSEQKRRLVSQIDLEMQEEDKTILDRITRQIQEIMDNLTPEEIAEIKNQEQQSELTCE